MATSGEPASSTLHETERTLLGALLEMAESGGCNPPALGLEPRQLRGDHAAATLQELLRLWTGTDPVARNELVNALVEQHGAKYSEAAAYLRLLRGRAPRQPHVREYVRRIKEAGSGHRGRDKP